MDELINVKFKIVSRQEVSKATHGKILKEFRRLRAEPWYILAPTSAKVEIEEVQYSATSESDFLDSVEKIFKRYRRGA